MLMHSLPTFPRVATHSSVLLRNDAHQANVNVFFFTLDAAPFFLTSVRILLDFVHCASVVCFLFCWLLTTLPFIELLFCFGIALVVMT
jgi:hypothetical protein